jgi:hypothetical protein
MDATASPHPSRKLTPALEVEFAGTWKNELGSTMTLTVMKGEVRGTYRTAVGEPQNTEEFSLSGFAAGDLIVFCVNFGTYGSLTTWAGQHVVESGTEKICTLWHLARNVVDVHEPRHSWAAVLTGANTFTRER